MDILDFELVKKFSMTLRMLMALADSIIEDPIAFAAIVIYIALEKYILIKQWWQAMVLVLLV